MIIKAKAWIFFLFALVFFISTAGKAYAYAFNITHKNALPIIQELSRKKNKTADDYLILGWDYYAFRNNVEKGASNLKMAIDKNPNLYEAYFLLGLLYKSRGEYTKTYSYWLKCLDFERIENALLIHDILTLDLSVAQIKEVIAKYESIVNMPDKNGLVVPHALYCLAGEYGVLGEVVKAKRIYKKLNMVTDWMVIGPFDNKEKIGFNTAYPPEKEIELSKKYEGKLKKIGWRKLIGTELSGVVDFDSIFYPNDWAVGYALTYVYSNKQSEAAIRAGSDDSLKVWLNDKLIIQREKYQAFILDQNEVGAVLHKGWNKLLVKVCEGGGDWRFGLHITDVNGFNIEGLKYSIEPRPYTSDAGLFSSFDKGPKIKTVKRTLKETINRNPMDYLSAYILAEWFRLLDLKRESMDEFEHLLEEERHCAIFRFGLANIESNYGDNEKALADYKETVIENPMHAEALMEIAYFFYENGMNTQALQYVEKSKFVFPGYIENYILASKIYSDKKWNKDAYDMAAAGLSKYPDSTRMLRQAASSALNTFNIDEAIGYYEKIMQLNKWLRPSSYSKLMMISAMKNGTSKIESTYRERADYYTYDSSFFRGMIETAILAQNYRHVAEYSEKASRISPDNYRFYEYSGNAYYNLGNVENALLEWDKALMLKPDYAGLRDRIEFAKGKRYTLFDKYTETNESVKKLLDTNDASEKYRTKDAVILLDKLIYNVHDDGSCEVRVHYLAKILTKEGVDKFSQISIPRGNDIKIEKAVVMNHGETDTEITEIDFDKGYLYPASLNKNSIIEYKYRYNKSGGLLSGYFYETFTFRELFPIYKKEVIIIIPKDKKLNIHKVDNNIQYTLEAYEDKNAHIWRIDYSPPIKLESFMPDLNGMMSRVSVSDIPSWDYLANWENNLIDDQLELDTSIKARIDKLTRNKKTKEEKIIAIYNYLNRDIHYLSLDHEVYGWKPSRATKVFKNQYGDCKDMAVLMIAMLKEIEVDAYYAILYTKPYNMAVYDIPIPIGNHAIVYIPRLGGKKNSFFDITASVYNYGTIPYTDEGVMAIILKRPGYEIVRIPRSTAEENLRHGQMNMTLSENKEMKFDYAVNCYGQYAGKMRGLSRSDTWKTWIRTTISEKVPGTIALKQWISSTIDLSKPFIFHVKFSSHPILKKTNGKRYEMSPVDKFKLMEKYAVEENRVNDMELGYARTIISEENFKVPKGLEILSMPEDISIDNNLVSYKSTYSIENNTLKSERKFSIKKPLIKKDKYAFFRDNLIKIDKLDERSVLFKDDKNLL